MFETISIAIAAVLAIYSILAVASAKEKERYWQSRHGRVQDEVIQCRHENYLLKEALRSNGFDAQKQPEQYKIRQRKK